MTTVREMVSFLCTEVRMQCVFQSKGSQIKATCLLYADIHDLTTLGQDPILPFSHRLGLLTGWVLLLGRGG